MSHWYGLIDLDQAQVDLVSVELLLHYQILFQGLLVGLLLALWNLFERLVIFDRITKVQKWPVSKIERVEKYPLIEVQCPMAFENDQFFDLPATFYRPFLDFPTNNDLKTEKPLLANMENNWDRFTGKLIQEKD